MLFMDAPKYGPPERSSRCSTRGNPVDEPCILRVDRTVGRRSFSSGSGPIPARADWGAALNFRRSLRLISPARGRRIPSRFRYNPSTRKDDGHSRSSSLSGTHCRSPRVSDCGVSLGQFRPAGDVPHRALFPARRPRSHALHGADAAAGTGCHATGSPGAAPAGSVHPPGSRSKTRGCAGRPHFPNRVVQQAVRHDARRRRPLTAGRLSCPCITDVLRPRAILSADAPPSVALRPGRIARRGRLSVRDPGLRADGRVQQSARPTASGAKRAGRFPCGWTRLPYRSLCRRSRHPRASVSAALSDGTRASRRPALVWVHENIRGHLHEHFIPFIRQATFTSATRRDRARASRRHIGYGTDFYRCD